MIIEIVKLERYHSIIVDGKVVIRDSREHLVGDLGIVFEGREINGGVSISNKVFDDDEDKEYENYLDSHT